jgi:hypothetical protein
MTDHRSGSSPAASTLALASFLLSMMMPALPASSQEVVSIPRISAPVQIDGRPVEPVWETVEPLPMTMFEPDFQGEITRHSVIRLAHDGRYLYASGVFFDDGEVRANSLVRNEYADDDFFNLVIDSLDDGQTALWFLVNPLGTRMDGAITNDAEGDAWNHPEFDNVWDAAAEITDFGWTAEMRIPLTSLRFTPEGDSVMMGLIAGRMITRVGERHTFPALARGPSVAQFKPSLAGKVALSGVEQRRLLQLRPYVLTRRERPGTDAPDRSAATRHDVGGDVKVGLGPHMTLDVTFNTDFAQTEADDERVNLSRFDLFFPEKRQFFMERAGAFEFGDRSDHRLFHSRRIGLDAQGSPETILGGVRLTGRVQRWEIGALHMQMRPEVGGNEAASVLRARRDLARAGSHVGLMATAHRPTSGSMDSAAGLDGAYRMTGSHFLTFGASASVSGDQGRPKGAAEMAIRDRDRSGVSYHFAAGWRDPEYLPPLGFVERVGVLFMDGGLAHGRFGGRGPLQEQILGVRATLVAPRGLTDPETLAGTIHWDGRRRGGGSGSVGFTVRQETLDEAFLLSPEATVPEGDYTFPEARAGITAPPGWRIRGGVDLTAGRYFDGHRFSVALRPLITFSRHLEVSGSLERNRVSFPTRNQRFKADVVGLRIRASLSPNLSIHSLTQYNGSTDRVAANLRVRQSFGEGRDLYLVWNEGRQRFPGTGDLVESVDFRGLSIKYSHLVGW